MKKRAVILGILLVPLLLHGQVGGIVFGAQPDPNQSDEFFDLSLEELMEVDVDTVYSASKYPQKVSKAPSSVTIITSDEIRKYGYNTLAEALRSVPGFYINYDRFYHYVGVRGYRCSGTYDTGILLLVDGHRTNQNIGDGPAFGTHFLLDVDLIEKIEVVRGPGSALYGSNALFAVINVITKRGRDIEGLELSGEVGSLKTAKGRLTYGNKLDNGLDVLVSATRYNSDGRPLYYSEFDSPATNNGWVDNDQDHFDNFVFVANVQWGDLTLLMAHTDRDKNIPTAPWGAVFGDTRTVSWDENTLIGLTYARELSETWSVEGRVSYSRYRYYGDWPSDYADVGDDPYIVVNKEEYQGRWWEAGAHVVGEPVAGHTVTLGSEMRYNVRQDQRNWDEDVYLDDSRDGTHWGLFVQDAFKLFDRTTLVGGLRYDQYSTFGGTTNPRVALIQGLCDDTTIKLLYGRAFRAPSVYDLYYNDGGYSTKAALDLDPETIETWEIVLDHALTSNWHGSVSGFYYIMDDLISKYTDPADGLQVFRNLNEVEAPGVEFALNGRWDSGWRTQMSYSYVEAEDETADEPLFNSPRHLAKFNLIAPIVDEALFAGLEVQYNGPSETLAGNESDDFVLTNLTVTYIDPSEKLEFSAGVYNLFDVEYAYPAYEEHIQDTLEQDGLTFRMELTYRF